MKNIATLIIVFFAGSPLLAQPRDFSDKCKEQMKKLDFMVGDWKGTAIVQTRNGPITVNQTEHTEKKLDGVALSIEDTGKQNDQITFQAYAILNYDPYSKQFKMRSYVKEGNSTDAYFKVLDENNFEWGFDIPSGGKVKYVITLDTEKKTWHELGEYSPDGKSWMKTIEMSLAKL